jgi:hypothetical protein
MTTYVNPYTGQTISPSQTSYESLTISTNTTLNWPINGTSSSNVVANIIEVTATSANLNLILPPATQVSVGQAIIVRNVGTTGNFAFNVVTSANSTVIVNIPVSASGTNSNTYYIYLTNNSTIDGTWSSIAMGIGTSSATAGALAGYGLVAINNTLNEATQISPINSNYQIQNLDRSSLITWNGGAGTLTLPNPALTTIGAGFLVIVKNNGTGITTVQTGAGTSGYIDNSGITSVQVQIANSSVFVTDGTNWFTWGLAQTNVFNYTQLVVNLQGLSGFQTLTSTQAKSVIQEYTGTPTGNVTVLLPQTVQLYSLRNLTGNTYNLTFGIGNGSNSSPATIGTTLTVPYNQAIIAISDGTNLYNANSATSSFIQALSLGNGTQSAPSLSFQSDSATGLWLQGTGILGFAISGVSSQNTLSSTGLQLPVGVVGGAF